MEILSLAYCDELGSSELEWKTKTKASYVSYNTVWPHDGATRVWHYSLPLKGADSVLHWVEWEATPQGCGAWCRHE